MSAMNGGSGFSTVDEAPAISQIVLDRLRDPFDPNDLYWKPQATNKDQTSAIAAVYADPRAYSDRLNDVLGPLGWSDSYVSITSAPFDKKTGYGENTTKSTSVKVLVSCSLTINGVTKTDVGEEWADDENSYTSAAAQAFKRACVKFGIGRYLYDFPKGQWCPYDKKTRKITQPPAIPDWAVPPKRCTSCHKVIQPVQVEKDGKQIPVSVPQLIANSMSHAGRQLCYTCLVPVMKAKKDEAGRVVVANGQSGD